MDRNTRTIVVLLVAVVAAGVATYGIARVIQNRPVETREVARTFVVAAAHTLPIGAMVTDKDLKLVPWPERALMPGSFMKREDVVNRGVVNEVLENEPLTESKLAPIGGGAGFAPTIPTGMRALSVRVNDVVGVAGFVVPGTRVDVFVTLREGSDTSTRVVVSNVQVLTAGTRYDQDKSKSGEAIPTSVVTLLVNPDDAARVVLASSEGQIMLTLRNPLDQTPTATTAMRTARLFGEPMADSSPKPQRIRPVIVTAAAPPPPPPPPPPPVKEPYVVEAIRAAKRGLEAVKQ